MSACIFRQEKYRAKDLFVFFAVKKMQQRTVIYCLELRLYKLYEPYELKLTSQQKQTKCQPIIIRIVSCSLKNKRKKV